MTSPASHSVRLLDPQVQVSFQSVVTSTPLFMTSPDETETVPESDTETYTEVEITRDFSWASNIQTVLKHKQDLIFFSRASNIQTVLKHKQTLILKIQTVLKHKQNLIWKKIRFCLCFFKIRFCLCLRTVWLFEARENKEKKGRLLGFYFRCECCSEALAITGTGMGWRQVWRPRQTESL